MKKTVMTVIRVIVIVGVLGLLTYGGFLGMNRVSGNGDYTIDAYAATDDGGQLTVTKAGTVIHVDCSAEQLAAVAAEPDATFHLTFYVRGGRISKVAGVFGGLLDICPLLNMDNLGRLIPRAKIRGKKRVMKEIVMRMEEHAQGGHDYSGKCYISNSACYDDARAVADEIERKFPKLNGKVEIYSVGTTIGSHTGPGTVALFFWGDERKD